MTLSTNPATGTRARDRYPTRVAAEPSFIDRTEPTVWGDHTGSSARDGMFGAQELADGLAIFAASAHAAVREAA